MVDAARRYGLRYSDVGPTAIEKGQRQIHAGICNIQLKLKSGRIAWSQGGLIANFLHAYWLLV